MSASEVSSRERSGAQVTWGAREAHKASRRVRLTIAPKGFRCRGVLIGVGGATPLQASGSCWIEQFCAIREQRVSEGHVTGDMS